MSEFSVEPGMITPLLLGEHLLSTVPTKLFHNNDALKVKFVFDFDKCILGI